MSVLLRHPATVPALFSGAGTDDGPPVRNPFERWRLGGNARLIAVSGWAAMLLLHLPPEQYRAIWTSLGQHL